jgi:hypothetical protein
MCLAAVLATLLLAACAPLVPAPVAAPAPVTAPAPVAEPPAPACPASPPPAMPNNGCMEAGGAVLLEQALVLAQSRNPADLARATAMLEPLARNPLPEQQPWQPLARLLIARIGEQRRLEEQLERQATQLRDSQKTVQQLNEKLEALKAIERSLTQRAVPPPAPPPSAPAAAPASQPRP